MAVTVVSTSGTPPVTINGLVSGNMPEGDKVAITYNDAIVATVTGSFRVHSFSAAAPSDTRQLWIDPNTSTGGLKFWDGSKWDFVPVAYT